MAPVGMVSVMAMVSVVGGLEVVAFEQATRRPSERCERQQDPLNMRRPSPRAAAEVYDEDRRKGRCWCCFGGGCGSGRDGGDWNAKGKEQLVELLPYLTNEQVSA